MHLLQSGQVLFLQVCKRVLLVGDSTLREDSAGLLVSFKLMKFLSRSAEETQIIGFSLGEIA